MTDIYFLIALIVITDVIILYCKYLFDGPRSLDKELNPDLTIGFNFWDSLALPLIFIIPFVWLRALTQTKSDLYPLPFLVTILLAVFSLILLIKHRFKRYYLTDNGIVILNLLTNKYFRIPIDKIQGYSFRSGYRSASSYLVATTKRNIRFSVSQINNIKRFKDYFEKHNIQYYEYDFLTDYDYKK